MSSKPKLPASDSDPTKWPGRDHVAIFIRCLHLLDLDLLEDWPGISENTFQARVSQQSLQLRTKGVEWSLYRLFELYSPVETREKLRPFFPPLTSLQSVNLRAALLRVLTELKKNGILPRDVVLRKTMLDECKGERFQELLSSFAMIVLRERVDNAKVTQDALLNHSLHTARRPEPQLVALTLAYRQSLTRALEERRRIQHQSNARKNELDDLAASLSRRKSSALVQHPLADTQRCREAIEVLRAEWMGDTRWVNTILYESRPSKPPDLSKNPSNRLVEIGTDNLLVELERRLTRQRAQLDRWRAFQQSFPAQTTKTVSNLRTHSLGENPLISFNKHQNVVLGSKTFLASHESLGRKENLDGQFGRLLNDLNRELSNTAGRNAKSLQFSPDSFGFHHSKQADPRDIHAQRAVAPHEEIDIENNLTEAVTTSPGSPSPRGKDSSGVKRSPSEFSWLNESQEQLLGEEEAISRPNIIPETLTERTRKSMAALFSSDAETSMGSPELPRMPSPIKSPEPELIIGSPNRRGTLLERTRQSMAATAPRLGAKATKAKPRASRVSQMYPTNQFETPHGPRYSMMPPSSNDSTPREKLFSEDAGYDSVFKSRPKIAQSPQLSPERAAVDDSILAREMTILDIGSDAVEYTSE